jgi:hypothetical protein
MIAGVTPDRENIDRLTRVRTGLVAFGEALAIS